VLDSVLRLLPKNARGGTVSGTLEQILQEEDVSKCHVPVFSEMVLHCGSHPSGETIQILEERGAECETKGEYSEGKHLVWTKFRMSLICWACLWYLSIRMHHLYAVNRVLINPSAPCDSSHCVETIQVIKVLLQGIDKEDYAHVSASLLAHHLNLLRDRLSSEMKNLAKDRAKHYIRVFFRTIRCYPCPFYRRQFLLADYAPLFKEFVKVFSADSVDEELYKWMTGALRSSIDRTKSIRERSGVPWTEETQLDQLFINYCGWSQDKITRVKNQQQGQAENGAQSTSSTDADIVKRFVVPKVVCGVKEEVNNMTAQAGKKVEASVRYLWMAKWSTVQKREDATPAFIELLNAQLPSILPTKGRIEEAKMELESVQAELTKLNTQKLAREKRGRNAQKRKEGRQAIHNKLLAFEKSKDQLKQAEKPLFDYLQDHQGGLNGDQKEEQRALKKLEYDEKWYRTCQKRLKNSEQLKDKEAEIAEFLIKQTLTGSVELRYVRRQLAIEEKPLDVPTGVDPLVWVKILEVVRASPFAFQEIDWRRWERGLPRIIAKSTQSVDNLMECSTEICIDTALRAMRFSQGDCQSTSLFILKYLVTYAEHPDYNELAF